MTETKPKRVKKLHFGVYVLYLLVVTVIVTSVSYSRFALTKAGLDEARVARPVITFVNSDLPSLSDLAPGETKEYSFKIENFDGNGVTEVTLDYCFDFSFSNIDAPEPLDMEYDLYYKPTAGAAEEHVGMTEPSSNRSNKIRILAGEAVTHTFLLKIKWNATQTTEAFAGKTNRFTISTFAEQVE